MIDTHAHIDTDIFREDLDSIIERAKSEGIEYIIIPAINPPAFDNLIEVVEKYDILRFGIGVHPHNANEINDEVLSRIKEIAKHPKCVAIGEIGIDYYYDFVTPEVQKDTFRKQLQIAKEVGLPVIVHNRDADEDILRIIEEEQGGTLKGVLHCFSSEEDVKCNF